MSFAITKVRNTKPMTAQGAVFSLEFTEKYATGGVSLTPEMCGLRSIDLVIAPPQDGYVFEYDYKNNLLVVMVADYGEGSPGVLVELANDDSDIIGTEIRCMVVGI